MSKVNIVSYVKGKMAEYLAESKRNLDGDRVMLAYDFDSRYIAMKHLLEFLTEDAPTMDIAYVPDQVTFQNVPYVLVNEDTDKVMIIRGSQTYEFTLPQREVPPGDCVYGCEGDYHPCGRYPKPVVEQIAAWLEDERVQFPQIKGWEKTMEAFKRAADAIRNKWGNI